MSNTWPQSRKGSKTRHTIFNIGHAPRTPTKAGRDGNIGATSVAAHPRIKGRGIRAERMSSNSTRRGFIRNAAGEEVPLWDIAESRMGSSAIVEGVGTKTELPTITVEAESGDVALPHEAIGTSLGLPQTLSAEYAGFLGPYVFPAPNLNVQSKALEAQFRLHPCPPPSMPTFPYHLVPFHHDHAEQYTGALDDKFFPDLVYKGGDNRTEELKPSPYDMEAPRQGRSPPGAATQEQSMPVRLGASLRLQQIMGLDASDHLNTSTMHSKSAAHTSEVVSRARSRSTSIISSVSSRRTTSSRYRYNPPMRVKCPVMTVSQSRGLGKRLTEQRKKKRLETPTHGTSSGDFDSIIGRRDSVSSTWDLDSEFGTNGSTTSAVPTVVTVDTESGTMDYSHPGWMEASRPQDDFATASALSVEPIASRLRSRRGTDVSTAAGSQSSCSAASGVASLSKRKRKLGVMDYTEGGWGNTRSRDEPIFQVHINLATPEGDARGPDFAAGSGGSGMNTSGMLSADSYGISASHFHPAMQFNAFNRFDEAIRSYGFKVDPHLKEFPRFVHDDQALAAFQIKRLEIGGWYRVPTEASRRAPDLLGYMDKSRSTLVWFLTYKDASYRIALPLKDIKHVSARTIPRTSPAVISARLTLNPGYQPVFSHWSAETDGWLQIADFTGGQAGTCLEHVVTGSSHMVATLLMAIRGHATHVVPVKCECPDFNPEPSITSAGTRGCACPAEIIKAIVASYQPPTSAVEPPIDELGGGRELPHLHYKPQDISGGGQPSAHHPARSALPEAWMLKPPLMRTADDIDPYQTPPLRSAKRWKSCKLDDFLDSRDLIHRGQRRVQRRDSGREGLGAEVTARSSPLTARSAQNGSPRIVLTPSRISVRQYPLYAEEPGDTASVLGLPSMPTGTSHRVSPTDEASRPLGLTETDSVSFATFDDMLDANMMEDSPGSAGGELALPKIIDRVGTLYTHAEGAGGLSGLEREDRDLTAEGHTETTGDLLKLEPEADPWLLEPVSCGQDETGSMVWNTTWPGVEQGQASASPDSSLPPLGRFDVSANSRHDPLEDVFNGRDDLGDPTGGLMANGAGSEGLPGSPSPKLWEVHDWGGLDVDQRSEELDPAPLKVPYEHEHAETEEQDLMVSDEWHTTGGACPGMELLYEME